VFGGDARDYARNIAALRSAASTVAA